MHDYIITPLGRRAFVLRTKDLVSGETPRLLTLREHHNLALFSVHGSTDERDRQIGYCLMFSGAPRIHHYTWYCSFSYSEPTEIRTRQMRFIFDDPVVRLARFGVGVFDYLWVVRKQTDQQTEVDVADHLTHQQFRESWKDGI